MNYIVMMEAMTEREYPNMLVDSKSTYLFSEPVECESDDAEEMVRNAFAVAWVEAVLPDNIPAQ